MYVGHEVINNTAMYNELVHFLSIDNVFFTVMGYSVSYLEFVGTILNIWGVYLVGKNKIASWPIGIVAVALFSFLFYQIRLYSDLLEQVYYLITGFWGWYMWSSYGRKKGQGEIKVAYSPKLTNIVFGIATVILTLILGYFVARIHIYFPSAFPEAASFPYLDAFTTVMAFAATIGQVYRRVESWYLWILLDIIGVWLYFQKEVVFVSLLYLIFLILAVRGWLVWRKIAHENG